ncbi:MAG: ABC transporter ATP-binding protein [Chloroflexi bacterium]|nr:ABC transporter ATP-binding protein [Chloroflexota bacterium]
MHYHGPLGAGEEDERVGKVYDHQVVSRLLPYLRPHKLQLAWGTATMLVATLTGVATPWLIGLAIDRFVAAKDLPGLTAISLAFLAAILVNAGASYIHQILLADMGQQVLYSLRTRLFDHLQRLSLSYYDRHAVGRVMSRVQNDVQQLQDFVTSGILTVGDFLSLVGVVVAILLLDLPLALITMSVIPVLAALMIVWQEHARRAFARVRTALAMVNAALQENISGVRVVQSLRREEENLRRFDQFNRDHRNANIHSSRVASALFPVVEVLVAVATALVLIAGGVRVLQGTLAVGALVAFALYVQRFFDPIRNLTMQYSEFQRAMVAGERIFHLLDTRTEVADAPHARDLPPPPAVGGEVRFEGVRFSYVPGVEVLHGIDLTIRPGETVALVGPTGAGKSTLAALVARFYDVTGGCISIDGHDIRQVARRSLVRQMALVLQEPFLFSASVKENIRYGRLDATDEEIAAAARAVGAHEFIQRLDNGYDTPVGERGINLSIGQRQLVSFARALLADPRILILDEATASVDPGTERAIQAALKTLLRGRTAIVIAHRLSTVRDADRIVVMDDGRVAQEGRHADLLAQEGIYARLWAMAFPSDTAVLSGDGHVPDRQPTSAGHGPGPDEGPVQGQRA